MTVPGADSPEVHATKCELASEVLRENGKLQLQVNGWSMFPAIWPGDTLLVERISSAAVCEGDIVLFERDRRLFAHRVTARDGDGVAMMVTRGDAMPMPDPPIGEDEFLGKIASILRNGKCIAPRRTLGVPERAIAALVQRSEVGARVVVGVHGLLRTAGNS